MRSRSAAGAFSGFSSNHLAYLLVFKAGSNAAADGPIGAETSVDSEGKTVTSSWGSQSCQSWNGQKRWNDREFEEATWWRWTVSSWFSTRAGARRRRPLNLARLVCVRYRVWRAADARAAHGQSHARLKSTPTLTRQWGSNKRLSMCAAAKTKTVAFVTVAGPVA